MVESEFPRSPAATLSALVGGGLIAATFLDFALWPLAWFAFVPILVALERPMRARRAIWLGLVAGMATNVPAFFWLVHTIHVFGGFPLWVSLFFYIALSIASSLQFVIFALALRRAGFGPAAIHPVLLWVTLEFFFPNLFPWRLANSQRDVPLLLQIGDVTGPFGLSFVMIWASAAMALVLRRGIRQARSALVLCAAAILCVVGYGVVRLPAIDELVGGAPKVKLGLVQGNLTIEEKSDVRYFEGNLDTYRKVSEALSPTPDVVIWPETVITEPLPRSLEELTPNGRAILGLRWPLFTGSLTYDADARGERFFNSVILFDANGRVLGFSDKQILMPFGEFMPFGSIFPVLKSISPQTGDFQAGTAVKPLDVPGVARFAPLNCYEDLRATIARRAVHDGRAQILFAVANDGWFGDSSEQWQHMANSVFRTVENGLPLVRCSNNGVTCLIDGRGRIENIFRDKSGSEYGTGTLTVEIPLLQPGQKSSATFYNRHGDWFGWGCVGMTMLVLLPRLRRKD